VGASQYVLFICFFWLGGSSGAAVCCVCAGLRRTPQQPLAGLWSLSLVFIGHYAEQNGARLAPACLAGGAGFGLSLPRKKFFDGPSSINIAVACR
jgi:hypothetical protein